MLLRCDLHLHTVASDGTYDEVRLAREAREAGLDVIAITDHDRWHDGGRLGEVELIAGCERSVGDVHVLLLGAPARPFLAHPYNPPDAWRRFPQAVGVELINANMRPDELEAWRSFYADYVRRRRSRPIAVLAATDAHTEGVGEAGVLVEARGPEEVLEALCSGRALLYVRRPLLGGQEMKRELLRWGRRLEPQCWAERDGVLYYAPDPRWLRWIERL